MGVGEVDLVQTVQLQSIRTLPAPSLADLLSSPFQCTRVHMRRLQPAGGVRRGAHAAQGGH